jgi:hypothetical protein
LEFIVYNSESQLGNMLNRRGPLSKAIGDALGVAQEYNADRKARKESDQDHNADGHPQQNGNAAAHEDDYSDDEQWALDLDAAQQYQEAPTGLQGGNIDELLTDFASKHPGMKKKSPMLCL